MLRNFVIFLLFVQVSTAVTLIVCTNHRLFLSQSPAVPCGYENVVKLFQSYTAVPQLKEGTIAAFADAHAIFAPATTAAGGIAPNRPCENDTTICKETSHRAAEVVVCTLPSSGEHIQIDVDIIQTAWSESLDVTNDTSIPFMMLSSLLECPIDLRKTIVQNVLLLAEVII